MHSGNWPWITGYVEPPSGLLGQCASSGMYTNWKRTVNREGTSHVVEQNLDIGTSAWKIELKKSTAFICSYQDNPLPVNSTYIVKVSRVRSGTADNNYSY